MITKEKIVEVLKTVNDPEIGMDIHTLGLIYDITLKDDSVIIKMTFTSPMCPYGPALLAEVKNKLLAAGLKEVAIDLVFDPVWKPSQEVKLMLGIED